MTEFECMFDQISKLLEFSSKNTSLRIVLSTLLSVFGSGVTHGLSCLINYIQNGCSGAAFTRVSNVILICVGFTFPRFVIGLKVNSRHFLDQSEVRPKLIATCKQMFFRASRQVSVIASSFDRFNELSEFFLTDQSDNLGFGLTTLN